MDPSQVFTDADITRAFEILKSREEQGWIASGVWKDGAELWKKFDYDSRIPFYTKFNILIDGVPIEACKELYGNLELRKQWDKGISTEELDSNKYYRTVHWKLILPAPCTPRDAVRLVTSFNWVAEENAYIMLFKNGQHPNRPETSDYIRMDTSLGYSILKQADNDPDSTVFFGMGNNDYGGWLPYCVLPYAASQTMYNLRDEMKKGYRDIYAKDKHQ